MLALHYGSPNEYSTNVDPTSGYLDYTTLTNMTSDRLNESKSPMVQVNSMATHSASIPNTTDQNSQLNDQTFVYYDSMDINNVNTGYNNTNNSNDQPLANGYQMTNKSPNHYDYTLQSGSNQQTNDYNTSNTNEQLPPLVSYSHTNQITVTIGSGTTQQRTVPVIYDMMQMSKGKSKYYING